MRRIVFGIALLMITLCTVIFFTACETDDVKDTGTGSGKTESLTSENISDSESESETATSTDENTNIGDTTVTDTDTPDTEVPDIKETVKISSLTVVRSEKPSEIEKNAAIDIFNAITKKSGIRGEIKDDFIRRGDEHDPEAYEILVGTTNYNETATALTGISEKEYSVSCVGNKIVIVCGTYDEYLLKTAAEAFISKLDDYISGENFVIDRTLLIKGSSDNVVLNADQLKYTFAVGGNNTTLNTKSFQKVYGDCSVSIYENYIKSLTESGNKILAENTIGNNLFTTLENADKTTLTTAYFIGTQKIIRIISEPWHEFITELPSTQTEKTCDTTLMQLECIEGSQQADIFRLADGRFVLYDTGVKEAAGRMIAYMSENNIYTDGKIHIAAIFISHPHGDHMGGLVEFADNYADKLVVEAVYSNLVAGTVQSYYSTSDLENLQKQIVNSAKKLGAKCFYARSGQKLTISDAVFEILFTADDLGDYKLYSTEPKDTKRDMNNSCMIVRATVKGQKLIFVGDCRGGQAPLVADMYREALRCDIMTVTHHGYNTVEGLTLYTYGRPSVVLWTNNFYDTERSFVNQLRAATYVKEHLLSDVRHILTLPYTPQK